MSDKPQHGRWDHLLREIPSPNTKRVSAKTPMAPPPVKPQSPEEKTPSEAEPAVLSVSEVNKEIKKKLEGHLSQIWVQGEISNFKAHSSGHFYFSLKDTQSQIQCVMFKGFNGRLRFRPESGMEVVVRGKVTVYEPRGNYQIFCESMEPVGAGALQKAFEQLKAKLQAEGLFEARHKKTLPAHPQRVAVVTSPTGAAIQDILNVLGRRSQRVQVTVIPVRVQGEVAAPEVVRAIELANQVGGFDVLIVGRGGGSIEDLWAFNEEIVARAIFASRLPVISAVGHEVDFTISDFVADLRAPTPSAAAEIVAKSEEELLDKLKFFRNSLNLIWKQKLNQSRQAIEGLKSRLIDPRRRLQDRIQRLDELDERLIQAIKRLLESRKVQVRLQRQSFKDPRQVLEQFRLRYQHLQDGFHRRMQIVLQQKKEPVRHCSGLLHSLSPLRVVDRGYAILRQDSKVISGLKQLSKKPIQIELRDGYIEAEVQSHSQKENL